MTTQRVFRRIAPRGESTDNLVLVAKGDVYVLEDDQMVSIDVTPGELDTLIQNGHFREERKKASAR